MLHLTDADIVYIPSFFAFEESNFLFEKLKTGLDWRQDEIFLFGRWVNQPRLTALYGDAPYSYSGITMYPQAWTPELYTIKSAVEKHAGQTFNTVLVNLYRNGNDSMGWHSDDEKELGPNPVIASVSFGTPRKFRLKHKHHPERAAVTLQLQHGSLLMMKGTTQHFWKHGVPKELKISAPRINLTFRKIVE